MKFYFLICQNFFNCFFSDKVVHFYSEIQRFCAALICLHLTLNNNYVTVVISGAGWVVIVTSPNLTLPNVPHVYYMCDKHVIHMWYFCYITHVICTPVYYICIYYTCISTHVIHLKTPHMYYRCSTICHVKKELNGSVVYVFWYFRYVCFLMCDSASYHNMMWALCVRSIITY